MNESDLKFKMFLRSNSKKATTVTEQVESPKKNISYTSITCNDDDGIKNQDTTQNINTNLRDRLAVLQSSYDQLDSENSKNKKKVQFLLRDLKNKKEEIASLREILNKLGPKIVSGSEQRKQKIGRASSS